MIVDINEAAQQKKSPFVLLSQQLWCRQQARGLVHQLRETLWLRRVLQLLPVMKREESREQLLGQLQEQLPWAWRLHPQVMHLWEVLMTM